MLIPHDKTKNGIIIEFKKVSALKRETLNKAADKALEQIIEKEYAQELHSCGVKKIVAYGIAFQGKKVLIKSQNIWDMPD